MATIAERRNREGGLIGWQAKVRRRGYPPQSKTFERKTDAQRWATEVEAAMSRGVFVDRSEAERNTLGDVLDRYLKEVAPTKAASRALEVRVVRRDPVALIKMAALGSRDVAGFRDRQLAAGMSKSTVVKRLNLISAVINHARSEWGINVAENVAAAMAVKRPANADRRRERRLSADEEERLWEQLGAELHGAYLRPLMRLAIETAARQGELCSLRWADVDLVNRTAVIRGLSGSGSKNGEIRKIPLSTAAIEAIRTLPHQLREQRLFPVDQNTLKMAFLRAVKRAEIENLTFHDLRHEATSRLASVYTNPLELMRVTGHKTLSMLARYYHADAAELARRLG